MTRNVATETAGTPAAGPCATEAGTTAADTGRPGSLNSGVAEVGVGAVRLYQWTIRPLIGAHCRFWPSCSEYAVDALRTHGATRGTLLAAKRILRCNPWNEGGVDLVPCSVANGIDRNTGH